MSDSGILTNGLPPNRSVHAAHIEEIHQVPMRVIIRPLPSVLDESKVLSLMETIQVRQCCHQHQHHHHGHCSVISN